MTVLQLLRNGDVGLALEALAMSDDRDAEWFALKGMALLACDRATEALGELELAVRLGNTEPATLLNLALAEETNGSPDHARALMRKVASAVPGWDEPWIRLAESWRKAGEHDSAIEAYAQALERNPSRAEALVGKAVLCLRNRDGEGAQKTIIHYLGRDPDSAEAWDILGLALMQTKEFATAETAFSEAQKRDPCNLGFALRRIEAAHQAGTAKAELIRLDSAAAMSPLNPTLPCAKGALLGRLGRYVEAVDFLQVANLLAPQMAQPALLLADLIMHCPTHPDAVEILHNALVFAPQHRALENNLGAILLRRHRVTEAADVLRDVLKRHPDDALCLANLANATVLLGRQAEAVKLARNAVALAPNDLLSHRALVNALPYAYGTDPVDLLAELLATSAVLRREACSPGNARVAGKRLRIGLLSMSLRTHPVGWLTLSGFENLDPDHFEVVCLAQEPTVDAMTRRFKALATSWRVVEGIADQELAALGRQLGIDILIDLGGYGEAGRMSACAYRLAPIQIKWVGMQNHSTGLAEMDYFITDRWETPEGFEDFYSEKLLRMPDGYVCYSPPPNAPDTIAPPISKNGFPTFGCFNNLAKITPESIETWSEILRKVPEGRMVLKAHQFNDGKTKEEVAHLFLACGVAPARIEFRGSSSHRIFLSQMNDVDILLDPIPYTGGVTTCEALWMGVPTVTLAGRLFAARHSCSHLSNVGLGDWIAESREEYVHVAVKKSGDARGLLRLRATLRETMRSSPLCDGVLFGRNLGSLLRQVWTEWCEDTADPR